MIFVSQSRHTIAARRPCVFGFRHPRRRWVETEIEAEFDDRIRLCRILFRRVADVVNEVVDVVVVSGVDSVE